MLGVVGEVFTDQFGEGGAVFGEGRESGGGGSVDTSRAAVDDFAPVVIRPA